MEVLVFGALVWLAGYGIVYLIGRFIKRGGDGLGG